MGNGLSECYDESEDIRISCIRYAGEYRFNISQLILKFGTENTINRVLDVSLEYGSKINEMMDVNIT